MNTIFSKTIPINNNNKLLSTHTKLHELPKLAPVTTGHDSNVRFDTKDFIQKSFVPPLKRLKTSQRESFNKIIPTFNTYGDINIMQENDFFQEEFFFQGHPFSDFILIVEGKEFYVDKSVLSSVSKIFHSYFQDENISSLEIDDVSSNDMLELLQFLYPQFQRTITYQNVTTLLILARRFKIYYIANACRTFILLYISTINYISTHSNDVDLIEHNNGLRVTISSVLDNLCIWYREFFYMNDQHACEKILNKLSQFRIKNFKISEAFNNLEEKIKIKIFQARAKYLESTHVTSTSDAN